MVRLSTSKLFSAAATRIGADQQETRNEIMKIILILELGYSGFKLKYHAFKFTLSAICCMLVHHLVFILREF